jgi:hypothetical protein
MEKLKPCPWCGPVKRRKARNGIRWIAHSPACPFRDIMSLMMSDTERQTYTWNTRTESEGGDRK